VLSSRCPLSPTDLTTPTYRDVCMDPSYMSLVISSEFRMGGSHDRRSPVSRLLSFPHYVNCLFRLMFSPLREYSGSNSDCYPTRLTIFVINITMVLCDFSRY
jgi:hypothetical protein